MFHFDFQLSFCFKTKWRASSIARTRFDFAVLILSPVSDALAGELSFDSVEN